VSPVSNDASNVLIDYSDVNSDAPVSWMQAGGCRRKRRKQRKRSSVLIAMGDGT